LKPPSPVCQQIDKGARPEPWKIQPMQVRPRIARRNLVLVHQAGVRSGRAIRLASLASLCRGWMPDIGPAIRLCRPTHNLQT
jgi:hypothetical protein